MRLQNKLFISIGLLILLVIIPVYFVSLLFFRKELSVAAQQGNEIVSRNEARINQRQFDFVNRELNANDLNLNAYLTYFQSSSLPLLDMALSLISISPDVSACQLHNPKVGSLLTLLPKNAVFYPVQKTAATNDLSFVLLSDVSKETLFLAVPFTPSPKQFFLLLDWHQLNETTKNAFLEGKVVVKEQLSPTFTPSIENTWLKKIEMIQILAPYVLEGLDGGKIFPQGICFFPPSGGGEALLSSDIFGHIPLFDDVSYFAMHAPSRDSIPLATGRAVMRDLKKNQVFLGNTALKDEAYISIGLSMNEFGRQLALLSDRTLIIYEGEKAIIGFSNQGDVIDPSQFPLTNLNENDGDQKYTFSRFEIPQTELSFYFLTAREEVGGLLQAFIDLNKSLARRLSFYMFSLIIVFLGIAFFVLWRITKQITKPLERLAAETGKVAIGQYDEIIFPEAKGKKDEVAKLTRAFRGMVLGLQEREKKMAQSLLEREKIRGVLDKVVSKEIADEILKSPLKLGGEVRMVTILFCDIRNFTESSRDLPPEKVIAMLNEFMEKMTFIIEGEGGIIDKYVGDEIMALYGAPVPHEEHVIRALGSARLMIEYLKKWNIERVNQGEPPIEVGIGIHTGAMVVGNMGTPTRLNYTVIGANVNLASRLCQIAGPMQVIISESVLESNGVKDFYEVKPLEPVHIKGIENPVNVYQVIAFKWEGP